ERIRQLTDEDSFSEEAAELRSDDPLGFFDLRPYTERLAEAELSTGLGEAMVIGRAAIEELPCELAVMEFGFMGGSMGRVVGEKFVRACESATERGVPLVSVTASGGARMQEGILSLMQLPKTVCAVEDLRDSGGTLISVMAHPTTAGVLASFASLGDVIVAEPGALLSFTGPRVVQQTTREKLPEDFGLAEPSDGEIWHAVQLARHEDRPYTLDYVERLFEDWFELHGDRHHGDDAAVVAGLGRFRGGTVVLVGNQKGRDVKERTRRNFGMAYPEGYGKAMRAMELADRHGFPLISLVDIPGAYPGVTAEQHGQGGAIARAQSLMSRLRVPVVTCVIGEGGSGGAIATALADRVLMQENAIYTVISPEGCAAILWRDAGEAKKAAAAFKPDAVHCLELGVIDAIVPEPEGGAHTDLDESAQLLGESVRETLEALDSVPADELTRSRRAKFR